MKHANPTARLASTALAFGACLAASTATASAQLCEVVNDTFAGVADFTDLNTVGGWTTAGSMMTGQVVSEVAEIGIGGLAADATRSLPGTLPASYRITFDLVANADATIELTCAGVVAPGQTAQVMIDTSMGLIISTRPGASPGSAPLVPGNSAPLEFAVDTAGFTRISYDGAVIDDAPFVAPTGPCSSAVGIRFSVPAAVGVSPVLTVDNVCVGQFAGPQYCTANNNSTGVPSAIVAIGTGSLGQDDVVLQMSSMPNNSFGFFITSMTQGFVANPAGSQGNLCLSGAIGRYVGSGQIQNSMGTGMISLPISWSMIPQPTMTVSGMVGETWNFQGWHRDSVMGMATSNFSNGVSVLVRP